MTICVGFVDQTAAYLIADSAVTSNKPVGKKFSSFGELQHDGALSVQEAALKIMRHHNSAAAFAGDARTAKEVFHSFVVLSSTFPIRIAFENAWMSHLEPNQPSKISVLFGYFDNAPRLLKFSNEDPTRGAEVSSACIGSISPQDANVLRAAAAEMPNVIKSGSDRLVTFMTLVQRLSIFENVMASHGIGGYVAGCSIGANGLQWAPDSLHMLLRDDLADQSPDETLNTVLTCARLDSFLVYNNLMPGFSAFGNSFGVNTGRTKEEIVSQMLRGQKDFLPRINSRDFAVEYLIFHNLKTTLSTVIAVRGLRATPLISYTLDPSSMSLRFEMATTSASFITRTDQEEVLFIDAKQ